MAYSGFHSPVRIPNSALTLQRLRLCLAVDWRDMGPAQFVLQNDGGDRWDRRRERWFSVCDRFQASGLEFPVNSVLDRRHELFRLSEPLLDLCFLERHEVAVVAFLSELEHAGVKPAGFDGYLPRFDKVLVEQLMTPPCFADESPLVRRSAVTA